MAEPAGIYCRLSLAYMGDQTKVEDQERICRRLAEARGWETRDELVWSDNNRSAWKRGRKRPGWDAMLEAVETGQTRNLVVYHGDRMVRQPYDLEILLNLADQRGIVIANPTGEYRLDVAADRFVMRILTAKACLESDDLSRRKKSGFERMALEGIAPHPGGRFGRGYGYERDGTTIVPLEAAVIEEAARAILAGQALRNVTASLAASGYTGLSGEPISPVALKHILTRPRVAGLVKDGVPGSWEPILPRGMWEMTGAVLRARAALGGEPANTPRYLLTGIARCGFCGAGVRRSNNSGARTYQCPRRGCMKIRRNTAHLDAYVTGRVVARLGHPAILEALAAPAADPIAAEIAQLEARKAETEKVIRGLADHPGADIALLSASLASFDRRTGELRAAMAQSAGTRLITAHAGISRAQFEGLPLHTRRAITAALYEITLLPVARRGPGFDPASVRMVPR